MIGPDGDVYVGVLDRAGTSRGFMEHYSANLALTKPTGAFGWDDTASVVPASMIPSYHGTSKYLIMTKYNNYAGNGGQGDNGANAPDGFSHGGSPEKFDRRNLACREAVRKGVRHGRQIR